MKGKREIDEVEKKFGEDGDENLHKTPLCFSQLQKVVTQRGVSRLIMGNIIFLSFSFSSLLVLPFTSAR